MGRKTVTVMRRMGLLGYALGWQRESRPVLLYPPRPAQPIRVGETVWAAAQPARA